MSKQHQEALNQILNNAALDQSLQRQILQSHLDSLSDAETEISDLKGKVDEQYEEIVDLGNRNNDLANKRRELEVKLESWEAQEDDLNSWKEVLQQQQNEMELTRYKAEVATDRKDEIKELFVMVVRNPTINRAVSGSIPLAVEGMQGHTDQYGNTIQPVSGTVQQGFVDTKVSETQD